MIVYKDGLLLFFIGLYIISYLVAATGLQSLWSLALATVDVYAILVKRSLQNRRLVSLFTIGDGVRPTSYESVSLSFLSKNLYEWIDK